MLFSPFVVLPIIKAFLEGESWGQYPIFFSRAPDFFLRKNCFDPEIIFNE